MAPVTYVRDVPVPMQVKVRARYADELRQLSSLGFVDFIFYSEVLRLRPLTIAMLILMRMRREVLFRHRGLHMGASYLLMQCQTPAAIALPMGMGVKFYTLFADGRLLITTTFPSEEIPDGAHGLRKHCENASIAEGWEAHRSRVAVAMNEGQHVVQIDGFDAYVAQSQREEAVMMLPVERLAR